MKCLHVIPSISRIHGGPSVAVATMTRALAEVGLQVDVVTTDDDGAGRLKVPLGRPIVRDGVTQWFFSKQTQFYKFSLPMTQWLARNVERYDVLHIHALFSYASMPAAYYAARKNVPYIVRPLGTLNRVGMEQYHPTLKRVSFPLIEQRIIGHAAFLHFTSELERAQAQELGVTKPGCVIPTGVALDAGVSGERGAWLKENAPQSLGRTIFLFLGRLDPIKGLDVLLPAFAQAHAREHNTALILAGKGEPAYESQLRAMCGELGIVKDVFFAGYVEGETKRALLRDADVFVLPSRSENQGVAVVEAMAAGLPVVVSPEVGIASMIQAGGAGVIVPPGAAALATVIQDLALDEARRIEMGKRGEALAREKFSIEAMRDALIAMYSAALNQRVRL